MNFDRQYLRRCDRANRSFTPAPLTDSFYLQQLQEPICGKSALHLRDRRFKFFLNRRWRRWSADSGFLLLLASSNSQGPFPHPPAPHYEPNGRGGGRLLDFGDFGVDLGGDARVGFLGGFQVGEEVFQFEGAGGLGGGHDELALKFIP